MRRLILCLLIGTLLNNAQAQVEDTLLLSKTFELIATNPQIAKYTMCINIGDFVRSDSTNKRAYLINSNLADSTSKRPILFIERTDQLTLIIEKMAFAGRGVRLAKDYDLYYLSFPNLLMGEVPFFIQFDSIYHRGSRYQVNFRMREQDPSKGWKVFTVENPPIKLYRFILKFKKVKEEWLLKKIIKKSLKNG